METHNINNNLRLVGCVLCELKDSCPDIALQALQVTLITEQVPINWIALLLIAAQSYATDLEKQETFELYYRSSATQTYNRM